MAELNRARTVGLLNKILEMELAGVVRYTHYSLMVYGYNRIPIVSLAARRRPTTSLAHAQAAGELVTHLGEHPSLAHRPAARDAQARHRRDPARVAASTSARRSSSTRSCSTLVQGKSVMLEEYAREMISAGGAARWARSTRCCARRATSPLSQALTCVDAT